MMSTKGARRFFSWKPSGLAINATAIGAATVGLSLLLGRLSTGSAAAVFVRDILMILVAGIYWPLHVIKADGGFDGFGLSARRWRLFLSVNASLGLMLLGIFVMGAGLPVDPRLGERAGEIAYVMLAGIFETIVFFSFIRVAFERSFGVIAGIVAAALFYSLHHAGFQPEFAKLFAVGCMYALAVSIANSALVIWPFFWGVGAVWDVLFQSTVVSDIAYPWRRAVILSVCMIASAVILFVTRTERREAEGGAILDCDEFDAEEYGRRMRERLGDEYRRFAMNAKRELRLPRGASALELGPGPGWAGLELARLVPDLALTAIEASPDMIRAARANAETEGLADRCDYREGYAEDLSRFADGSFDAVISRDSLHHWTDPAAAFREIERVLTPGGRLFIFDSRRNLVLVEWLIVHVLAPSSMGPAVTGWHNSIRASYTPAELRRVFESNGLSGWRVRATFLGLVIWKKVVSSQ